MKPEVDTTPARGKPGGVCIRRPGFRYTSCRCSDACRTLNNKGAAAGKARRRAGVRTLIPAPVVIDHLNDWFTLNPYASKTSGSTTPTDRTCTESIDVFRVFGGHLFAPCTDPSRGAPARNSFATNMGGMWHQPGGAAAEHIFDVADSTVPGEYFICGSSGGGRLVHPTVWRSGDYGQTWEVFFQEPPEEDSRRDGHERFYWLARLGDKLYCRADGGYISTQGRQPLRVFDLTRRTWGIHTGGIGKGGKALTMMLRETRPDLTHVIGNIWYQPINDNNVAWFDGKKSGIIDGPSKVTSASPTEDGRLVVSSHWTHGGDVWIITGQTAVKVATGAGQSTAVIGNQLYTSVDGVLKVAALP